MLGERDPNRGECWADVAVACERAIRAFDAYIDPLLAKRKLSNIGVTNVIVLLTIGPRKRRMVDLVRDERYRGTNASYAVNMLENAGLVRRWRDPNDLRMRLVEPTEAGRRLIAAIRRATFAKRGAQTAAMRAIRSMERAMVAEAEPVDVPKISPRARHGAVEPIPDFTPATASVPLSVESKAATPAE